MMGLYRLLLRLYPASFRAEYGDEMCGIFARERRDAGAAAPWLWLRTIFETVYHAAAVHLEILRQDLRYTARTLAASRAYAVTAVLVAALGIGATTAVFSLVDHVLVRPLPFRDSARLVKVWEALPGYSRMELSPANYRDFKRLSHSFEEMAAFTSESHNLVGQGEPERIIVEHATAGLFPLLGVQPLSGRVFTTGEDEPGAAGTLVLGYGLWQGIFGGNPDVVGRRVLLDDRSYTVIGIMPPDFHFPDREAEAWAPLQLDEASYEDRNNNYLEAVARLRPGISLEQARADMRVAAAQLERRYPRENEKTGANVAALRDEVSAQSRLLLGALAGASLCVLLIGCTNLAGLLLARALARRKEMAVRASLGAGRERLIRQLVTESLTLAGMGGVAGVLLARAALPLLGRLAPSNLPIAQTPSLDLRLMGFALLLTAATGLAFGLVPALRVCRSADFSDLREGARSGGARKERLRAVLVAAEVAITLMLLVSSGLLIRALWRIEAVDPGFRADGVLTLRTWLPWPRYQATAQRAAFYNRVLDEVKRLPGVTNAGYISFLPMTMTGGIWPVSVSGDARQRSEAQTASLRFVTPGLFQTLGIPLRMGRNVAESDAIDRPFVAVVSESLARRYWPGRDPLGRHFTMAFHDRVVVGVVADIRVRGLERQSEPQVYLPYQQVPDEWLIGYTPKDLAVRCSGNPLALAPAIRKIVRQADPRQPVSDVRLLTDIVGAQTAPRAIQLRVLGAFAAIAFLLAAVGIHGLLAFAVSQRTREIGVRVALGARRADIVRMVIAHAVRTGAAGLLLGVGLGVAAGKLLRSLLAGVQPFDPAAFLAAGALCLVMTAAGCLLPAIRALRVDPASAMRTE